MLTQGLTRASAWCVVRDWRLRAHGASLGISEGLLHGASLGISEGLLQQCDDADSVRGDVGWEMRVRATVLLGELAPFAFVGGFEPRALFCD